MNRLDRLDRVDLGLVEILRRNGRASIAAIGREVGLSRTAVQARIARLEDAGIILGYSARLAPEATGRTAALITLTLNARPCDAVLDVLLTWPEVEMAYSIAGDRDAVLVVSTASPRSLSELSDRLLAGEGVAAVETTVILAAKPGQP